jgi:hypothetical protein
MDQADERPSLPNATREALLAGGILAVVMALVWVAFVLGTHVDPEALADARTQPRGALASGSAMTFNLDLCSHCPMYVVAGRGLLHGYEMPDKKLWLLANWPALAIAARPPGRHNTAEIPLASFSAAVLGQWFLVGVLARFAVLALQIRAHLVTPR